MSPSSVLAVIVTYNPDVSILRLGVQSLLAQSCTVVLIDNASNNRDAISQMLAEYMDCDVSILPLDCNLGLGAAYNKGIMHARQNQFEYILLLDQDSVPLANMVSILLEAQGKKSNISAVGVSYVDRQKGHESFFVRFGWFGFKKIYPSEYDDDCIAADFLISSGSLFKLDVFQTVGNMDESLFIDHIDTEWFLRAKSKGLQAYGVAKAVMQHGLGEMSHSIKFTRSLPKARNETIRRNIPQHKPFRYYYIYRNSVLLYQRNYVAMLWKWNDLIRLIGMTVLFGLIKSPRLENLKMMSRGVWHGLRGTSGSLIDSASES